MPSRDYPLYPARKISPIFILHFQKFPRKPYNKSIIDQACSVKMTGCCPRSFFLRVYGPRLSWSINTQIKNLTNIQPCLPHTWSIIHRYPYILTVWVIREDEAFRKYIEWFGWPGLSRKCRSIFLGYSHSAGLWPVGLASDRKHPMYPQKFPRLQERNNYCGQQCRWVMMNCALNDKTCTLAGGELLVCHFILVFLDYQDWLNIFGTSVAVCPYGSIRKLRT